MSEWAYKPYRSLKRACVRFHLMQYPETDNSICYSCNHPRHKHKRSTHIMKHEQGTIRRVYYCLWNDGTRAGSRYACSTYHVYEFATDGEASSAAIHFRDEVRGGKVPFKPSVFVYISHGSRFGFFVCKTLEPQPNVFINFHSINELDSKVGDITYNLRSDCVLKDETEPQVVKER